MLHNITESSTTAETARINIALSYGAKGILICWNLNRLGVLNECDRQTDGRTSRWRLQ